MYTHIMTDDTLGHYLPCSASFLLLQAAAANQHIKAIWLQQGPNASDDHKRPGWTRSFSLVAMVHLASCAVGGCLRLGPSLLLHASPGVSSQKGGLAQLQQLLLSPGQGREGVWQQNLWGWGCGSLLVLLMVGVEVGHSYLDRKNRAYASAAAPKIAESNEKTGEQGFMHKNNHVGWLQVKVILVSFAAAVMAAVACLNWALAYVTCLVLMPLVAATGIAAPPALAAASAEATDSSTAAIGSSAGASAAGTEVTAAGPIRLKVQHHQRGGQLKVLRWLSLFSCSPPALIMLMGLAGGHDVASALQPNSLWWMVLESRWSSYAMFWAVYMPFWTVCWLLAWHL